MQEAAEVKKKRVFIAVNLPEKVKKEIHGRLSSKLPKEKAKVVEQANLHITMKFLGYLEEEKLNEVRKQMKAVNEYSSFTAVLEGLGRFGTRVLWFGVRQGSTELKQISGLLDEALGLKDERFHPHVTLARNKEMRAKEVDSVLKEMGKENYSAEVKVESVDLMESKLSRKGPKYSVIEAFELK